LKNVEVLDARQVHEFTKVQNQLQKIIQRYPKLQAQTTTAVQKFKTMRIEKSASKTAIKTVTAIGKQGFRLRRVGIFPTSGQTLTYTYSEALLNFIHRPPLM
jgi:hypothetical protein